MRYAREQRAARKAQEAASKKERTRPWTEEERTRPRTIEQWEEILKGKSREEVREKLGPPDSVNDNAFVYQTLDLKRLDGLVAAILKAHGGDTRTRLTSHTSGKFQDVVIDFSVNSDSSSTALKVQAR